MLFLNSFPFLSMDKLSHLQIVIDLKKKSFLSLPCFGFPQMYLIILISIIASILDISLTFLLIHGLLLIRNGELRVNGTLYMHGRLPGDPFSC